MKSNAVSSWPAGGGGLRVGGGRGQESSHGDACADEASKRLLPEHSGDPYERTAPVGSGSRVTFWGRRTGALPSSTREAESPRVWFASETATRCASASTIPEADDDVTVERAPVPCIDDRSRARWACTSRSS